MCYTRAEIERSLQADTEPNKEGSSEVQVGKTDEVKRFEHMPSSLPHVPEEPTLTPA
jgi:hypothetical protein